MTEQQPYDVLREYEAFEIRRYPEHVVAEVTVDGPFDSAASRAFRLLFAYITGANAARDKIAMTAPVLQRESDPTPVEDSAHAAVETTTRGEQAYRVSFVLPASMTAQTAPAPEDPAVRLRTVPESIKAAARYSGRWSEDRYRAHLDRLRDDVASAGLAPAGPGTSARFDPPYMPPFLRHNEVLLDVDGGKGLQGLQTLA